MGSCYKSHAKLNHFGGNQKVFGVPEIIIHLRPVNQNSNFKMKKIITFVAVSAMVSLAACGGGEDEAKRKADSTKAADSVAAAEAAAKAKADSTRMADSMKAVHDKWVADSTHQADSTEEANKKKGTPKPKTPKPADQPKVGGTRGGK